MFAIYEFTSYLRIPAESIEEARTRAEGIADAVRHGEVTLELEESEPYIEMEVDDECA